MFADGERARAGALPKPPDYYVAKLRALAGTIREAILAGREAYGAAPDRAAAIVKEGAAGTAYSGDTIYGIDERGESALFAFCDDWAAEAGTPFVLIAEGLPGRGRRIYPDGAAEARAVFECIVDPIDGTRCLMYDKRSAWVLAAIAPGPAILGRPATLADITVAVQAELPTSRARLADTLWAVAGQGATGETVDLVTQRGRPLTPAPSRAATLAHGFAAIAKFFPGTKLAATWVEERLFAEVVGEHAAGAPLVFEDQYVSSAGQLYELIVGHDRFVADLRPVILDAVASGSRHPALGPARAGVRRLCARPYDLCTWLIASEAGVIVTDERGQPLAAPLDTVTDIAWCGYANQTLRERIEPALRRLLDELRHGAG